MIATGARPRPLPGLEFDGKTIITYKEAMSLPSKPESMLILGAGPIGLEFGYFYNAIGTKVTVVELLDRILPAEDEEVSAALHKSLTKRGLTIRPARRRPRSKRPPRASKPRSRRPTARPRSRPSTMLVAIGVQGNVEGLVADELKLEIVKNHIKADPKNGYVTSVPDIYAVGDVIGPPWLAHVATHEAICCIERLCGFADHPIDYTNIPGCTYTDPGVASVGLTEKAAKEAGHEVRDRQVPLPVQRPGDCVRRDRGLRQAGLRRQVRRAVGSPPDRLAGNRADRRAGDGQEARGDRRRNSAAMHPHPTYSEAIMEAAGQGLGQSVHI